MKRLTLIGLILITSLIVNAQKKFEFGVSAKLGYYFLHNEFNRMQYPGNTISPGGGISLAYSLFDKTKLVTGFEGIYLHPKMVDFWDNQLDVKWHSINIPFYAEQGIGSNLFINGGVTLIRQITGYWNSPTTPNHTQQIPELNWQTAVGWNFDKLRISINYSHGFNSIEKKIKTSSNSFFDVGVKHREIYFKVEYSLWRF